MSNNLTKVQQRAADILAHRTEPEAKCLDDLSYFTKRHIVRDVLTLAKAGLLKDYEVPKRRLLSRS